MGGMMPRMGPSCWGHGAKIGAVYRYSHADHACRMGHNERQPGNGDLCLCVRHSGDCFYDYAVLRFDHGQWTVEFKFGAYAFGTPELELSTRAVHLLLAGEGLESLGLEPPSPARHILRDFLALAEELEAETLCIKLYLGTLKVHVGRRCGGDSRLWKSCQALAVRGDEMNLAEPWFWQEFERRLAEGPKED